MPVKDRPWSEFEDGFLRYAWAEECVRMGVVCRSLRRSEWSVRGRIAQLGITRSASTMRAKKAEDMARVAALNAERAERIENRDEAHWRKCLSLGGFPNAWLMNGRTVWSYPNPGGLR